MKVSSKQINPKLVREVLTVAPTKFLAFFPDGHYMIQVSLDWAVQLRVSDGQKVGLFMKMPDVNACAISRDGNWFIAGHDDGVTIWDTAIQTKACEHKRTQDLCVYSGRRLQAPYFTALDISVDSSRTVVGDSTGSIILLSIPSGEQLAVCNCGHLLYIDSLRLFPGGDLAVGTAGKMTDGHVIVPATLHIWDVSSCDQLTRRQEVPFGSFDKDVALDERPIVVNWSDNEQQVLVGSHRSLVAIDVVANSVERKDIPSFHSLLNDGQLILSMTTPSKSPLGVYFWDPVTLAEIGCGISHHLPLAVSLDSTLLATLPLSNASDGPNVIFIWTLS